VTGLRYCVSPWNDFFTNTSQFISSKFCFNLIYVLLETRFVKLFFWDLSVGYIKHKWQVWRTYRHHHWSNKGRTSAQAILSIALAVTSQKDFCQHHWSKWKRIPPTVSNSTKWCNVLPTRWLNFGVLMRSGVSQQPIRIRGRQDRGPQASPHRLAFTHSYSYRSRRCVFRLDPLTEQTGKGDSRRYGKEEFLNSDKKELDQSVVLQSHRCLTSEGYAERVFQRKAFNPI
jgi:hypothetical protein